MLKNNYNKLLVEKKDEQKQMQEERSSLIEQV